MNKTLNEPAIMPILASKALFQRQNVTSDSKSNTLISELSGHVLLRDLLLMHHLIFGLGSFSGNQ